MTIPAVIAASAMSIAAVQVVIPDPTGAVGAVAGGSVPIVTAIVGATAVIRPLLKEYLEHLREQRSETTAALQANTALLTEVLRRLDSK